MREWAAPQPPTVACKNGSSVGIRTRCIRVFCTFGTDLYAPSVLINKVSASQLSRKFIKVELLAGTHLLGNCHCFSS